MLLVVWIIFIASPDRTFRLTWAPLALVAIFFFMTFKETFVVHGPAHKFIAFAACLVALLAVPVKPCSCLPLIGTLIFAGAALVVVDGPSSTVSAMRLGMGTSLRVPATIVSPSWCRSMISERTKIHQNYYPGLGLSAQTVSLASGKTTYIQDGEAGISWAYPSLLWKPLPVLEEYMAFTPYLDQLNANFIASYMDQSEYYARRLMPFDRGIPAFESPATVVSMICHYGQLGVSPSWQVLGKVPDRCGSMREISMVHSGIGQIIKVPKPTQSDQAIIATISPVPLPLTTAPVSFLFKTSSVKIQLNKSANADRFIPSTAGQPHLMVEPEDLGYSCASGRPPTCSL